MPKGFARGDVGAFGLAAQALLQVALAVAIEDMADEAAVEIRGAKQPVKNDQKSGGRDRFGGDFRGRVSF